MPAWDVFRSDRLQAERNLSTSAVRAALAEGRLRDDDLVRPAGSDAPWTPIADVPALARPADRLAARPDPESSPALPSRPARPDDSAVALPVAAAAPVAPVGGVDDLDLIDPAPATAPDGDSELALPVASGDVGPIAGVDLALHMAADEPAPDAPFSLAPEGGDKMEEMDLTAMVDIAMQLIMFFLVTATTIYFKSLEIPTPDPDKPQTAEQSPRNLDDLEETNILVEVDARGQIQVDHEPITPDSLVPKLRAAREATGRTAILLMADPASLHRTAVRVLEAANELGLSTRLGKLAGSGPDEPGG